VIFNYGILHNEQPIKVGPHEIKKPSVPNVSTRAERERERERKRKREG
jgi:hypothetical protein